jgi:hypothetical protein
LSNAEGAVHSQIVRVEWTLLLFLSHEEKRTRRRTSPEIAFAPSSYSNILSLVMMGGCVRVDS